MSYYAPYTWNNLSLIFNLSVGYDVNDSACAYPGNGSDADCGDVGEPPLTPIEVAIIVFLSGFIFAIIVGNVFVILAVLLFRDMRTLTNGLIVSLASADLLVAIIVLPLSLYHEIVGRWDLGPEVCDFWITSDVFCCTSSILNIVVIAVDRYWLITRNVRYTHNTTFPRKRVCLVMAALAWVSSLIISSSPLLGWRKGNERDDPSTCLISQDVGYTLFSTFGAFWFPLAVILAVYFKIFRIARRRALTRVKARTVHPSINSTAMSEMNGKLTASRYSRPSKSDSNSPPNSPEAVPTGSERSHQSNGSARDRKRRYRARRSGTRAWARYRGRLRSSARTLGLIIGGFVLCWLPFFIMATIVPFCSSCVPPQVVASVVLWLGYSNSLLNPAIYAIWDKNFRRSFKRLATCDIRCTTVI
ncbi:hypothetical protein LSH36_124g04004 [Paralvinella palmiformis]|uniref:G-protein coupled receptors family 1 profile domain-containing protein n=1 Tax=Paralvinella palmiformis TaxID=53620 RepID=A0AAD9JX19_9ANNE|nr:hypothetical protein LSH36_124g04004 [Paralvinella palmiformis]